MSEERRIATVKDIVKEVELTRGTKALYDLIKSGYEGKNIGISSNSDKLDSLIYGIQKGFMYTVGADTGGGKTSFVLDCFVYNLIKNSKVGDISHPVRILYFSFEMSEEVLLTKLLSRYILDKYKVILTYKDILSFENKLSLENQKIVEDAKLWINSMSKILMIYDTPLDPTAINDTLFAWLSRFGKFETVQEDGANKVIYTPKDPNLYLISVIDHVGLISKGSCRNIKEAIDSTIPYFIAYRSMCKLTSVMIQQMNRNAKSVERKTKGYSKYQINDFKDTSSTTDASEVILGLYYPYREKIAKCGGYPIADTLKGRFRLVQLMKNRYGISDINFGMNFYGEIGLFRDMPLPTEIRSYDEYLDLNLYLKNKQNN